MIAGAIISGVLGAAGGIMGGMSKNSKLAEQQRLIEKRKRENQNWYDRRYNEDATQRADAQRMLTLAEDSIKRRNRAAAGRAAVMGGTEASVAAEKEAGNKMYADVASQIAAAGEKRKDDIEARYQERNDKYEDAYAGFEAQKSSGLDMASAAIAGVGGALSRTLPGLGSNKKK